MTWLVLAALTLLAGGRVAVPPEVWSAWIAVRDCTPGAHAYRLIAVARGAPVSVRARTIMVCPATLAPHLPAGPPSGRRACLVFLLGHELGHEAAHPDDQAEELQADFAGGATMRRARIPRSAIPAYIAPMLSTSSSSHGTSAQRIAAVEAGWLSA